MEYTNYLISNKTHVFDEIQTSLGNEKLHMFNGTNYPSFSKLVNDCVFNCPTEVVIIMSDRVRPRAEDVSKMVSLINKGYGFVGMYRFAFFGFKKQLFRQIGMLDERYVGGGYEDDDFYIRLAEANISMYISHEVEYHKGKSSWNYAMAKPHFMKKWPNIHKTGIAARQLPEESYSYNLGKNVDTTFLPFSHSNISVSKIQKKYTKLKFK